MRHVIAVILLFVVGSSQAALITVDFEGATAGGQLADAIVHEPNGFTFNGVGLAYLVCTGGACPVNPGDNSLGIYGDSRWSVEMVRADGQWFDLLEMDAYLLQDTGPACGGGDGCYGEDAIVSAYDQGNNLIAQRFIDRSEPTIGLVFDSNWTGIYRLTYEIQIAYTEGVYGHIDNIKVNVVPIPAAVWLFGSALAGLGWMRRRQTA
jgi:hypothetical protein